MKATRNIFLSYRSNEVEFALRLATDLKNAGVNVWMDRLDIAPGDDWPMMLQKAVSDCAALIPVLSPEYVNSKYCKRELSRADRLERPVFPVLLRPVSQDDWPMELERQQYIDFVAWRDEKVYRTQMQKLIKIIRERLGDEVTVIPDAETRYVNNLIAELEAQRNIIGYFEFDMPAVGLDDEHAVRPQPIFARTWNMQGRFILLNDGSSQSNENGFTPALRVFKEIYEALANHPRFVLLGGAGSGKTTTLQNLALEAAHQYRAAPNVAPLPLLLNLVNWQDDGTPEDFIRSQWLLDSDALKMIAKGKIALYLDGLNELGDKSAEKVAALGTWFNGKHAPQRVIVTCRKGEYEAGLGIPVIEMSDLNLTHIHQFVEHYLEKDNARDFLSHLMSDDEAHSGFARQLYQMARNPFLLSALLVIYNTSPDHEVIDNIGILLRKLVARLWERFNDDAQKSDVTFEQIETGLTDLAFAMVEKDTPVYIAVPDALEYLGSQSVLQTALSTNLMEQSGNSVRFSHQMVQQYFAALGLRRGEMTTRLSKPQFDDRLRRIPTRWDAVVMIRAGIDSRPEDIILQVCDIDPFLALHCALHLLPSTSPAQEVVHRRLLERMVGDHRVGLAATLMGIDDEKALFILIEVMREAAWAVRLAAASLIKEIDLPMLPGLTQALEDLEDKTRENTLSALRQLGKSALPTLFELLRHPSWHLRRGAAWALGALKEKGAVPLLLEMLNDPDNTTGAEAAIALGRIKDAVAISGLVATLNHEHWRVGKASARSLSEFGKSAINSLLKVLDDSSAPPRQQARAIEALAFINDERAANALIKASHSSNIEIRSISIEGMRNQPVELIVPRLIQMLADTAKPRSSKLRICDSAAVVLEAAGTPEAVEALRQWRKPGISRALSNVLPANSENPPRSSGRKGRERLERIIDPSRAVAVGTGAIDINEALQDEDWLVRKDAVVAQATVNPTVALPRLTFALKDEDSQVRLSAVTTLTNFRDSANIVPLLMQALADDEIMVSDAAKEALKQTAKPPVPALVEQVQNSNVNVCAAAIEILGAIRDASVVSELTDCLSDIRKPWMTDQHICDIAAKALETIGTAEAMSAVAQWRKAATHATGEVEPAPPVEPDDHPEILLELLNNLHSNDWSIRHDTAKSLREYARLLRGSNDPEIIQRLTAVLEDKDWGVRHAAVEALGWISDPSSVPPLLARLKDNHWMVRGATLRALIEIGDTSAVDDIVQILLDPHDMVREAAAEALGFLRDARAIPALLNALNDRDRQVRLVAIEALGKIGDAEAAPALLALLNQLDPGVRWLAADALGRLGTADVVQALITCLSDTSQPPWEDRRVCDVAVEALESIGTPQAMNAVALWRGSPLDKTKASK